jgi:hypothetical protein
MISEFTEDRPSKEPSPLRKAEGRELISWLLSSLTTEERHLIEDYCIKRNTLEEIAATRSTSKSRIGRKLTVIMNKLYASAHAWCGLVPAKKPPRLKTLAQHWPIIACTTESACNANGIGTQAEATCDGPSSKQEQVPPARVGPAKSRPASART